MQDSFRKKAMSSQASLLKSKWYNLLEDGEDPQELEKRVLQNEDLFLILATIIQQKIDANSALRRSKAAYDKPAFSEFQADCNGYERALEEVLSYLKITKET